MKLQIKTSNKSTAILFIGIMGACLLLVGCIPLKQLQEQPSSTDFGMTYDCMPFDCDRYVLLVIGKEHSIHAKKEYQILENGSYAFDKSGRHYPISVKPHDYDLSQSNQFIRDRIYVLRSKEDKRAICLHNGLWTFHLVLENFENNGQSVEKEFSFRLWTFYYCPIIHGAPN